MNKKYIIRIKMEKKNLYIFFVNIVTPFDSSLILKQKKEIVIQL